MAEGAVSSRACSSPAKAPSVPPTGMRSPTKIRTPTKLARPRETHWASKAKDVKKRLLEAGDGSLSSALPPPKRTKLSAAQTSTQQKTVAPSGEDSAAGDAVEAATEAKEDEGHTGYAEGLQRQVEVARCLEEELLRDNARMRLKASSLRDEVDFTTEFWPELSWWQLSRHEQVETGVRSCRNRLCESQSDCNGSSALRSRQ